MSVEAMTWALRQVTGNVSRKVVLLILADRAGFDDWECWPSQQTIAEEAELSERQVRRILADLETGGFITREKRYREHGDGGRKTDLITLTGQIDRQGVTGHLRQGYRTSTTSAPYTEPSVEPSEEPSPSFDDFWASYPRKRRKGEARLAWNKLPRSSRWDAINGARRHAKLMEENPDVFVLPDGPVWLNKRRWEDEEPLRPPRPERKPRDWAVELGPDWMANR